MLIKKNLGTDIDSEDEKHIQSIEKLLSRDNLIQTDEVQIPELLQKQEEARVFFPVSKNGEASREAQKTLKTFKADYCTFEESYFYRFNLSKLWFLGSKLLFLLGALMEFSALQDEDRSNLAWEGSIIQFVGLLLSFLYHFDKGRFDPHQRKWNQIKII